MSLVSAIGTHTILILIIELFKLVTEVGSFMCFPIAKNQEGRQQRQESGVATIVCTHQFPIREVHGVRGRS